MLRSLVGSEMCIRDRTETGRQSAVQVLHSLILLCEHELVALVEPVLLSLTRARTASSSKQMAKAVDSCAAACGVLIPTDVSVGYLVTLLLAEPGAVPICTQLLAASQPFGSLQYQVSAKVLHNVMAKMVSLIEAQQLDPAQIHELVQLSEAVGGAGVAELPQLVALFAHLVALANQAPPPEQRQLIQRCAAAEQRMAAGGSVRSLYREHADGVMKMLIKGGGCEQWVGTGMAWQVFELVCSRSGPEILLDSHQSAQRVLLSCVQSGREAGLKIRALALLQTLLEELRTSQQPIGSHPDWIGALLLDGVLPNAVWRAGKLAAQSRQAALRVIEELAAGCMAEHKPYWQQAVRDAGHGLVPLLLSALEDDDGGSRLAGCQILQQLLAVLPFDTLAYDQVRVMIPELLKRLDDSREVVRKAALGVVWNLASVIDHLKVSTYVEYITAGLLVYIEDSALQPLVVSTLERYAKSEPEVFKKEINKSIQRGVATNICLRLLELANGLSQES
eukprot:TRINITY_DN54710_c0_g1_i1.p1 TRINITY_DN54710_c0_g1~~TRINITY_DN54710_c0_g1_i1.p1  ORF type:complete len:552 (-),score=130.18 TRINITY_DN54710_c0_g1_i1:223-1740(-)